MGISSTLKLKLSMESLSFLFFLFYSLHYCSHTAIFKYLVEILYIVHLHYLLLLVPLSLIITDFWYIPNSFCIQVGGSFQQWFTKKKILMFNDILINKDSICYFLSLEIGQDRLESLATKLQETAYTTIDNLWVYRVFITWQWNICNKWTSFIKESM